MKTRLPIAVVVLCACLLVTTPATAAPASGAAKGGGALQGTAQDPGAPQLGDIDYLFNQPGYQLWWTMNSNLATLVAGHSYHAVYKYAVEDPTSWCGPFRIPDIAPYNAGGTAGRQAYYKTWDVTAEVWNCGSD